MRYALCPMVHLDSLFLSRLSAGQCTPEEIREAWRHAATCEECAQRMRAAEPRTQRMELLSPDTAPEPPPAEAPPPQPAPGQALARGASVGRYLILHELGQGSMGVVHAAYDPELDRRVALKLLRTESIAGSSLREQQARLLREAQAMARVSHPNVVAVYDAGAHGDQIFMAMELVDGETLGQWLKARSPSWQRVLSILLEAGRGLAAVHAAGLVHRDFKPDNVLVGKDGKVRVTDFGVARLADPLSPSGPAVSADVERGSRLQGSLTMTGVLLGTPLYMAPEQHHGLPPDMRSDQFSFCVTLYETLYGQRPFRGDNLRQLIEAKEGALPLPPRGSRVPARVYRVLARGLSREPEARFPSMEALLEALQGSRAQRRGLLAAAGVLGLGLALGGYAVFDSRRRECEGQERWLEGVWDANTRQRVHQALVATELPYAASTAERVQEALDGYARDWVRMRTEVCEASRNQGSVPAPLLVLRTECLEQRRSQLQVLAEVLANGSDATLLPKAVPAAQGLSPVADCADVRALTQVLPPPVEPQARAKLEALRAKLDRVAALYATGKYQEGLGLAEPLLAEVEALGYPPLEALTLHNLALLKIEKADYEAALAALRRTIRAAARSGDAALEARAWTSLYLTVCTHQGLPQQALPLRLSLEAALDRAQEDRVRVRGLGALGTCYFSTGDYEAGRPLLEQARDLAERTLGIEPRVLGLTLSNLGIAYSAVGRYEEGRQAYERALALMQQALGPDHPQTAVTLTALSANLLQSGRFEEARGRLESSLALVSRLYGPEHPRTAYASIVLSAGLRALGRWDEALVHSQHALSIRQRLEGPEGVGVAEASHEVGDTLVALGRYEEAMPYLAQARRIYEKSGTPLGYSLLSEGELYFAQGRYEQARVRYEQAVPVMEKAVPPGHADRATAHIALGRTLLRLGELQASERHLTQALELLERLRVPSSLLGTPLLGLGELYLAQGRVPEALSTLERALSVASPGDEPQVRQALAEALARAGKEVPRALELAGRAREHYRRVGNAPKQAEVERWLERHGGR